MDDIIQQLHLLVKKKMREQGGYDREAYAEFVNETIDYFLEKGKLDPDDNLEFIKNQLLELWEQTENGLAYEDEEDLKLNFPV